MKLFLVSFTGVYLGGYGLILAVDADDARKQVIENGIDGFYPDDVYETIEIGTNLRELGDRVLIWNGDY